MGKSGNSQDRRKFRRLVERIRRELLLSEAEREPPPKEPMKRWPIVEGSVFISLLVAYPPTTGLTDMDMARGILLLAWIVGVFGVVTLAPIWSRPIRHKLYVGCVIAGLLAFGLYMFDGWIVKRLVRLSPNSTFTLSEPIGSVATTFYVNNQGNDPVYSVWVKIQILTKDVSADTISIDIDESAPARQTHPFNDKLAFADAKWLVGTDEDGFECVVILFPSVPPHTTYHLDVKGSLPIASTARANLMGFTHVPSRLISGRSKSGFEFQMPESFTVRSLGFKVVDRKNK